MLYDRSNLRDRPAAKDIFVPIFGANAADPDESENDD